MLCIVRSFETKLIPVIFAKQQKTKSRVVSLKHNSNAVITRSSSSAKVKSPYTQWSQKALSAMQLCPPEFVSSTKGLYAPSAVRFLRLGQSERAPFDRQTENSCNQQSINKIDSLIIISKIESPLSVSLSLSDANY